MIARMWFSNILDDSKGVTAYKSNFSKFTIKAGAQRV